MKLKQVGLGLAALAFAFGAMAEVDVTAILNESAMWLDASKPESFVLNEAGGVTKWINQSAAGRIAYGDAEAYMVNTNAFPSGGITRYGNMSRRHGVPVYEMHAGGSEIDLKYTEIPAIRTVFFVGEFLTSNILTPFLGHTTASHFHRNSNGAFWSSAWADDGDGWKGVVSVYLNSATVTADAINGKPRGTERDIVTFTTSLDAKSNRLSCDRNITERTGGRALSEVIIIERELTAEERAAVYAYLDTKWNQGGWDTGAYPTANFASWGGIDEPAFTANATLGATTDTPQWWLAQSVTVDSGVTATINTPMFGGNVRMAGGGALAFAGGAGLTGELSQEGGTLNLGGGTMDVFANPALTGDVRWENGTFLLNFYGEFRPLDNSTLTLGNGARVIKNRYWRTFIDKGVTLTLETGSYMEVPGPMCVACDFTTANVLNLTGGTLVVTNCSDTAAAVSGSSLNIMTQQKNGSATLNMESGRIITTKLRVAADWFNYGTGVQGTGTVNVNGGAIETLDCVEVGSTHASKIGTAFLYFNGGEVTAPNGIRLYRDDHDTLVFNGTVFHATADCAKYLDFRKNVGSLTTLAAGGLPIDVAADKKVTLGWGLVGEGGLVKRGAGTLTLDKAASFEGGVVVEAGTLVLGDSAATGTGPIQVRSGATLEFGMLRPTGTLSVEAGSVLQVTLNQPGVNEIVPVVPGFSLANVTVTVLDLQGTELSTAVPSVTNGKLVVTVPDLYTAPAANADWYSLAWTSGGASVTYPTEVGKVVNAQIVADGNSAITLGQTVNASLVDFVNAGDARATVSVAGPGLFASSLGLSNFKGELILQTEFTGGAVLSTNAILSLDLSNEGTRTVTQPFTVSGNGLFRKLGGGTLVYPGLPTQETPLDLAEGTFALQINEDMTATAATKFTDTMKAGGVLEKRGEGKLTVTGGTFAGQMKVMEGQLFLDGPFQGITATAERPFYIGPNGSVYIQGSQTSNRLPAQAAVVVDGGTFTLSHVNPAPGDITIEVKNGGTFIDDHTRSAEHQKFTTLTFTDSTWCFTGTKAAYSNNGCYMNNPCRVFVNGNCTFEKEEGNPNQIQGASDISLVVNSGAHLSMGLPFMRNVNKTGPGVVRFTDGCSNASATFTLSEGVLESGGTCPKLAFAGGTTFKVVEGTGPLTVTTLTMPSTGSVILDLSGIDFANRTEPVQILKYVNITANDIAKFSMVGRPGDPWKMSTIGGITFKRVPQPEMLTWNTGDGDWTETAWNNDAQGYGMDGYHRVNFVNSTNENRTALSTVTVDGERTVVDMMFTASETPYRIVATPTGMVTAPSFLSNSAAGFSFEAPLKLINGGISFAATTADQAILDPRGTIGAVSIPAAAGGNVLLAFGNNSQMSLAGGVSIESGKTVEIRNDRTSAAGASIWFDSPITAPADSKMIFSAPVGAFHTDIRKDMPNLKSQIEIKDGGFLHVNGQFNQVVATAENPVWVHGENSTLSLYGNQVKNRFPNNGHVLVTDGGKFWMRGVNINEQQMGPFVTVSNATFDVSNEKVTGNSHLHFSDVTMYGESTLILSTTTAAWGNTTVPNQGGTLWGQLNVKTGANAQLVRASGNPNHFLFSVKGGAGNVSGTLNVESNAVLNLGLSLFMPPIKTGLGTLVLLNDLKLGYANQKTLTLQEGWLFVNAKANDMNALAVLNVSNGAGLDLSTEGACFGTDEAASALAPEAGARVFLKVGERELAKGEYLVRWKADSTAPNCTFALEKTGDANRRYCLQKVADGVIVATRSFAILLR